MYKNLIKYFFIWSLSVLILGGGLVLIQKSGILPQLFPEKAMALDGDCNLPTSSLGILGYRFDTGSWQNFNLNHETSYTFGIHANPGEADLYVDGTIHGRLGQSSCYWQAVGGGCGGGTADYYCNLGYYVAGIRRCDCTNADPVCALYCCIP